MADNILDKIEEVITSIPTLRSSIVSKRNEAEALINALSQKKEELLAIEKEKARIEAEKAAAALLASQKAEEEKKAQEEIKVEEETQVEEVKEEPVPVVEPIVEETPVQEEPVVVEEVKEEEKKPEPIISADGKTMTTGDILYTGETRRVFIPPKKEPKITTKVFSTDPNKTPKQKRPTQPTAPQKTEKPKDGGKPISAPPTNFPPQKQNTNANGKKNKSVHEEKTRKSERDLIKGHYITDTKHGFNYDEDDDGYVRTKKIKKSSDNTQAKENKIQSCVISTEIVAIKTLCSKTGIAATEIIKKLFMLGMMKTINDSIDIETAQLIADEFNITIEYKPEATSESTLSEQQENTEIEDLDKLQPRPPIITIMARNS